MKEETRAWYALRRTLPPWKFKESLKDLLDFCRSARVDEVIIKCDTEEFSHGYPSVEWLSAYAPRLEQARDALKKIGVAYSLNPWVTQGHCDRGRDIRHRFPGMRMMSGIDGTRAKAQACPLCEVWREHTGRLWTIYARTRPRVIWLEDDLRTFNHRPLQWGCFCEEHLRRFCERAGEQTDRADIEAAILAPGEPHPWRAIWLDLQSEVMADTIQFLERTVHTASPGTRLGLMSSGPAVHACEGRSWRKTAAALAGPKGGPIYSRPPLGNYSESSIRGIWHTAWSIKHTRHCLPANTIEQTEVENWPFTQYSKSAAFTSAQIALSFALGADGVTLNLYDHIGTPMAADPVFGRMLAENKAYFQGLAGRCSGKASCAGIRLLHHDKSAYVKRLFAGSGADYGALIQDGHAWHDMLEALGMPTTYDPSHVTALTGQIIRAFPEREIRSIFSGGVLLDATAVDTLQKMGLAGLVGVEIESFTPRNDIPASVEEFFHPGFGGAPGRYMTMTIPDLGGGVDIALMKRRPGAVVISRILDPDRREIAPFITVYQNKLGGRAAVLPIKLYGGRFLSLLNHERKRQFSALLKWLSRGRLPIEATAIGGVYPLAFCRRKPNSMVVGAFNMSLDPWSGVEFDVYLGGKTAASVEMLGADGKWRPAPHALVRVKGGRVLFRVEERVTFGKPVVLDVRLRENQVQPRKARKKTKRKF